MLQRAFDFSFRAAVLAFALVLPAAPVTAGYSIYVSPDDSGNPAAATPSFDAGTSVDLPVYIVNDEGSGDSGAQKCSGQGTGDEVCAWLAAFEASGGVSISAFLPGDANVVVNLAADKKSLKANGLDVISPAPGPSRMGTLRLDSNGPGRLDLVSGEGVGSRLTLSQATPTVLAFATEASVCDGDGNGDGAVDGADYTVWADHFGTQATAGATAGDYNGDGMVDGGDYTIWADNFGCGLAGGGAGALAASQTSSEPSGAADVEPGASCGLGFELVFALIGLGAMRRGRSGPA